LYLLRNTFVVRPFEAAIHPVCFRLKFVIPPESTPAFELTLMGFVLFNGWFAVDKCEQERHGRSENPLKDNL
jgi:hypothetical protein